MQEAFQRPIPALLPRRVMTNIQSEKKIDAEILALRKALMLKDRWNAETRVEIECQIEVLEKRMTVLQVESRWFEDETSEEYEYGGNDLWTALDETARWLNGQKGVKAPSENL